MLCLHYVHDHTPHTTDQPILSAARIFSQCRRRGASMEKMSYAVPGPHQTPVPLQGVSTKWTLHCHLTAPHLEKATEANSMPLLTEQSFPQGTLPSPRCSPSGWLMVSSDLSWGTAFSSCKPSAWTPWGAERYPAAEDNSCPKGRGKILLSTSENKNIHCDVLESEHLRIQFSLGKLFSGNVNIWIIVKLLKGFTKLTIRITYHLTKLCLKTIMGHSTIGIASLY